VVRVSVEGYESATQTVDVKADKDVTTAKVRLRKIVPVVPLVVMVKPDTSEIRVDGVVVGERGVYAGQIEKNTGHEVEVRAQGFRPVRRTLTSSETDKPVGLSLELEPLKFPLQVTSQPPGASVLVAGKELGRTPASVNVVGDVRELVLKKRCYEPLAVPVKLPVVPGDPTPIGGALKKQPGCR
jgi:hypothetical protein